MKRCLNLLVFSLLLFALSSQQIKGDSIEVEDCLGRKVLVNRENLRIATLFAVAGHTVAMLGGGKRIVAVSRGLVRDKMFNMILPHIRSLPVPKAGGAINIEALLVAKPTLLLVDRSVALNPSETGKFKKFGLKWLGVEIRGIESQFFLVNMLGKVLNREDVAADYIGFYKSCINIVKERTSTVPPNKRVRVFHSNNEPTHTDAPGSLPAEWIDAAGMVNVSTTGELNFTDNKYYASMEQILKWNPQVILVNEEGKGKFILNSPQWKNIEGVKDKKVFLMPNGISRWGHTNSIETPLAILWTAKKVYPSLMKDVPLENLIKDFYKRFFRIDIGDKLLKRILGGKGMRKPKKKRRKNR